MKTSLPEKARLLERLKQGNFNVPDFIYVPAIDFEQKNFEVLNAFLKKHQESFKVLARSAHPQEEHFKGGTFESLETYADLSGIQYARKRMIKSAKFDKKLTIQRQQKFHHAPAVDPDGMGVIVMPFIEGSSVMAKIVAGDWEFGYCRNRLHKVQQDPYITRTPHDQKLLQISEDIQTYLGFACEIEYVISADNEIHVVQAKDISHIEMLEQMESERSIRLDGIYRIRKRRNYRERTVYVMDNTAFYISVISKCEDMIHGSEGPAIDVEDILEIISEYESGLEEFALKHQRFGIIELSTEAVTELYQIANHYLNDFPDSQKQLSNALHNNRYKIDYFLSESDTFITKDKIRVNLGGHDAYGINTVRYPLWSVYWKLEKHEKIVKEFKKLGFKTGDLVGIDIDTEEKPTIYRL
ncbi:MAG: hypothetical protein JSU83_03185 [Deltaproteobacteria bacterium]|nr:MAG: hypothetical protein JSU83_03185 [Deltaproteobacteria bacterium]